MNFAFEKLDVWHKAMELAGTIYKTTQSFPAHEQFGLTSQIRRAAVSIPLNIAEGKGRYHTKEFVRFLYNARGSLYEVVTLLKLAKDLQYLNQPQHQQAMQLVYLVMSKLSGLINSLKSTPPSSLQPPRPDNRQSRGGPASIL